VRDDRAAPLDAAAALADLPIEDEPAAAAA